MRRGRRGRHSLVFVLGLAVLSANPAAASFWLSGEDPVVQHDKHKDHPADYMDLFKPGAPWSGAASKLTVFTISMQFVLRGDPGQLRAVIDGLRRRHIALGVAVGVLDGPGAGGCGNGVEGYSAPATVTAVAGRIRSLGGTIDYLAMDEPVWYGHIFRLGRGAQFGCQAGVEAIADDVAAKAGLLRQLFPRIQIGDVEPINARDGGPRSIDDIIAFVDRLRQGTGVVPAFVHADIAWRSGDWRPLLTDLATRLRARGVRLGVICDGTADAAGDAAWVSQALQRCQAIAADGTIKPADYIVASWEALPTRMLPETDAGTLTYAVAEAAASLH